MLETLINLLDFVMIVSFSAAIILSFVMYRGRRSIRSLSIGIFFVVQIILELVLRTNEVDNSFTRWWNSLTASTIEIKGLCYTILITAMTVTVLTLLEIKVKPVHFIIPLLIALFLLMIPSLKHKNMIFYCTYFIPCELYYMFLSVNGLRKLKLFPSIKMYRTLKKLFIMVAIFSVVIMAEDIITAAFYGFFTELSQFTMPTAEMYIKERSYSESIMVLLLAWISIKSSADELIATLSLDLKETPMTIPVEAQVISESIEEPKTDAANALDDFTASIGLSLREKEVLPLLLKNRSLQSISEELFISMGTVKTHAHNIYQKANVSDRAALIQLVTETVKNGIT